MIRSPSPADLRSVLLPMSNPSPCLSCGACCAAFRVSFYWAEADDAPGGWVPAALTERLDPHLRCMRGTNARRPRCEQLTGEIPGATCRIYGNRPSPCRELEPWDAEGRVTPQCTKARALHGLPALEPGPAKPPNETRSPWPRASGRDEIDAGSCARGSCSL
jgi:Fe-S-cluster containining protein